MKNCKVCGEPLQKKERSVHYACRCVEKFKKNGGNTSNNRRKRAFKEMINKPNVFLKLFV